MFLGGVVALVSTGGNPLIVSGTMSAARSIIKDLETFYRYLYKVSIILSFTFTTKTCLFSTPILAEVVFTLISLASCQAQVSSLQ